MMINDKCRRTGQSRERDTKNGEVGVGSRWEIRSIKKKKKVKTEAEKGKIR